jgi:hypothetical protein
MFDNVSRWAERVATGVSRRAFLARLGLVPLAAAVFVGEAVAGKIKVTCVEGGSCCGGAYPYFGVATNNKGQVVWATCFSDAQCTLGNAIACAPSSCCGGAGYCDGTNAICYADHLCNTAC